MMTLKMMVVQDFLTESVQNKELQDEIYYNVWFEYLMNFDKLGIRKAYQDYKEKKKNAVDAETLRQLGYSEEDINKAQLE